MKRSHEANVRVISLHYSGNTPTSVNRNPIAPIIRRTAEWEDRMKKLRLDDSFHQTGQKTKRNREASVPVDAFSRMMMKVRSGKSFQADVKEDMGGSMCGICRQPNTHSKSHSELKKESKQLQIWQYYSGSDHAMAISERSIVSNAMQTIVKCHHCEQNIGTCCTRSCNGCDFIFCVFCTTLLCHDNDRYFCFSCHDLRLSTKINLLE
uniref:AlNc14C182G8252 protein n=1 Tax=Albugo laibachii Nc14 TaxID=890382 RepID=F0WPA4_9STRA|nr:AlNc14C182G8252 [Albugo laibachii Nc14]|eukprot:CCA23150.1 AlNc14C182G8252 [Albugo laibachii Nc14]